MLGDEKRRKEYDEVRRAGPSAFGMHGGPGAQGGFSGGQPFDMGGGDISDLISQMFGGRGVFSPSVDNGQRIRIKGRGEKGRSGGPSGDLLITCNVAPHAVFGREGKNLTVALPITFTEAALGANIEVPTVDGSSVTLRLKAGTQAGSRHRVKSKGSNS
ncbi:MAG: J domain-containing protein, partial [Actinomycetota bacterium]